MFRRFQCLIGSLLLSILLISQVSGANLPTISLVCTNTGFQSNPLRFTQSDNTVISVNYSTIKSTLNTATLYPVYVLDNPMNYISDRIDQNIKLTPKAIKGDKQSVIGILALAYKYTTVANISSILGIGLTEDEFIGGVNVALFRTQKPGSGVNDIFDESSIENNKVKAVADLLFVQLAQQKLSLTADDDIMKAILGEPAVTVDQTSAVMNDSSKYMYYGPYSFNINGSSSGMIDVIADKSYGITTTIGGSLITSVKNNQKFYIQFDKSIIGGMTAKFRLNYSSFDLGEYGDLVTLVPKIVSLPISITINNKLATGIITYTKIDSNTNMGIDNVTVQIIDSGGNNITQITTNKDGIATSSALPVGTYTLKELSIPLGYNLSTTPQIATISSNGQIVNITSKSSLTAGSTTIKIIDANTGGAITGSEYDLYTSTGARVGAVLIDSNGECSNIDLDPGDYYLKETKCPNNYQWTVGKVNFTVSKMQQNSVTIAKTPTFSGITVTMHDTDGTVFQNGTIELYSSSSELITELITDSNGQASLSVPPGTYYLVNSNIIGQSFETLPVTVNDISEFTSVNVQISRSNAITISGSVINTSGTPIFGVGIKIVNENGNELGHCLSNYSGEYSIKNIPITTPIWFKVYISPKDYSGDIGDAKLVTGQNDMKKDLTIKRLSESTIMPDNTSNTSNPTNNHGMVFTSSDGKYPDNTTNNPDGSSTPMQFVTNNSQLDDQNIPNNTDKNPLPTTVVFNSVDSSTSLPKTGYFSAFTVQYVLISLALLILIGVSSFKIISVKRKKA